MSEEINDERFKECARELYTKLDKNIRDIALQVGIDEAVVNKWAKDGKWDFYKCSLLTSKAAQLGNINKALATLDNNIKTGDRANLKDVDQYLKYSVIIKNLETGPTAAEIIEVSELFIQWLRRKDLKLAKKVVVQLDTFIQETKAA